MFADTLDSSWAERSHRAWTTLTSLGWQALVAGVLLLLPLLRPAGLPLFRQLSTPVSLGRPLEPLAVRAHAGANAAAPSNPTGIIFRLPGPRFRSGMPAASDDGLPQIGGPGSPVPGGTGDNPLGVRNLFEGGVRPVLPAPKVAPLRVSHMS